MSARPEPAAARALVRFAAAMTAGDPAAAARALRAARSAGARRAQAEETALMLVLHAGYPAALEGARVLSETWPGTARVRDEGDRAAWRARGRRRFAAVYGAVADTLEARVAAMHPALATWMVEEGYGRVLSRPGLDAATRELVAVGVLAAGGWERQLLSHLLGARRLGAAAAAVRHAWSVGRGFAGRRGRAACERAWRDARAARG